MNRQILHILGTRPQIIKAAGLINNKKHDQLIIDTNQHFDEDMQLKIYKNLNIDLQKVEFLQSDNSYSNNISIMSDLIYKKLKQLETKPTKIIIYGDTNSTIAGLIAGKITSKSNSY